jgi:alginate O-acetyltransferase complex protein AlgI
MPVTSMLYAFFAFGVIVLVAAAGGRWREGILLAASLLFYSFGSVPYAVALVAFAAVVWAIGLSARGGGRGALTFGVVLSVAVLGVFKYTAFGVGTYNSLQMYLRMGKALGVPSFLVPLGISFITFGLIHYLVEMWKGEAPAPDFLEFLTYVFFFPTAVAGPIKRYPAFIEDLRRPTRVQWDDVRYGAMRVAFGLFKKIVLADTFAGLTGQLLTGKVTPMSGLLLSIYAFAFQIWLDFSGYSDIAIGVSRMLGFKIIENFDKPYLQPNIAEFWGHWHMSLTRFITEYVFIPLGGSRVGRWKTARNSMIAMAVSGLWHGASWHFVIWGLYHGVGLVVHRWFKETVGALKHRHPAFAHFFARPVPRMLSYGTSVFLTFNFVAMGWVLFAVSLSQALTIYGSIATWLLGKIV